MSALSYKVLSRKGGTTSSILAIALLVAIILFSSLPLISMPSYPVILGKDPARHIVWSLAVAEQGVLPYSSTGEYSVRKYPSFVYPPFFHLLFGTLMMICGYGGWTHIYILTVIMTLFLNALFTLPAFIIGRRLSGWEAGVLSAFFVSTSFLKFETVCWGEYPMLLSFLLMSFLAIALTSKPTLGWATISVLLSLGVLGTHPISAVLLGSTLALFGLIDLPFGADKLKRVGMLFLLLSIMVLPAFLIIHPISPFILPQAKNQILHALRARSVQEFLRRFLELDLAKHLVRIQAEKLFYNWWNLPWRIGYVTLVAAVASQVAIRKESNRCFHFLLAWVCLSFTFYFGYLRLCPDYLRFLQCSIVPLTILSGVGLSHILMRRTNSSQVSILLILLILIVLGIPFLTYAHNLIWWMSKECFTTLPLQKMKFS
jgi:hypothetical protein